MTLNKKFYDSLSGKSAFMGDRLFPVEDAILTSVKEAIRGKAILEIGVGSGRVTPHLRALTERYVGIDYSPTMIEAARALYPDVPLFVHDAADMSVFKTGEFDAVFFSWNGIDEVTSSNRIRILGEVHRVLTANGIFVFSAHNLDWKGIPSYALSELSYSSDLLTYIQDAPLSLTAYIVTVFKHLYVKLTSKRQTAIWEYFPGSPKRMLVPRTYIRPEAQIRQLFDAGFRHVEAMTRDGTTLTDRNRADGYFVYYLARKGRIDGQTDLNRPLLRSTSALPDLDYERTGQ
jgi:ubiquinone/menaquinone biosynthesis C-methylase UbiE